MRPAEDVTVLNGKMATVKHFPLEPFEIFYFTAAHPNRPDENHDSLWISKVGEDKLLLCVADGAGGHRLPGEASATLIRQLKQQLDDDPARVDLSSIIHAIEAASEYIRTNISSSRSTVALALIDQQKIRVIHVGDSKLLLIGGRGKLKYETVGHNLYELSVDAGLMEYVDDSVEVPGHIVTNFIGDRQFRMEVSINLDIAQHDTIVIGSDGLFDNFSTEEICEICRNASPEQAASILQEAAYRRMTTDDPDEEFKADDITFIICRPQHTSA